MYRTERQAAVRDVSPSDRRRFVELASLGDAGGQRRDAIPATSYGVFMVTVDVPEGAGCEGKLNVSMPPGIQYFSTAIERAPVTRVQFSAARLDSLRPAVDAANCKARLYYRLDRPADARVWQGPRRTRGSSSACSRSESNARPTSSTIWKKIRE